MSKTRSLIAAIFVLVVGAMFVVACGGDDDDDGGGATATATTDGSGGGDATDQPTDAPDATDPVDSPGTTQPPTGGILASDSCDLLTQSEVQDALGEAVQEPTALEVLDAPVTGGGTASVGGCGYSSESFASSISLTYWYAPGLEDGIRAMIDLACGQGQESISGLGDKACWYDQQHAQIQLAKDGYFLDIFATMSGDASDVLLTLAEKAVEKLS